VMPMLRWPPCPLERNYSYAESAVMVPGITGMALFVVLVLMAYTSRHGSGKFERFWNVHNCGMWLWVAILFFHGTQDWFGIGFPLVVPVCTLPATMYLLDRFLRVLRYYLFKGRVGIVSVVIRPGKDGGPGNAMTAIEISKPPLLWSLQEGMYAYLCIPEISRWQWHPFTICSCREDDTVDFIIQGLGDWTKSLAQRCLDLRKGGEPPAVALDGPYAAPVTTALASKILIAVGAGVGITPFLSLMACIIAALSKEGGPRHLPLQEAHFFWMTRSADEFLFGRRHFTRIASRPHLRDKVFLHLHLTQREPERDAPAFLFREVVRRQSYLDRAAFLRATEEDLPGKELQPRPQLPWTWVDGASSDIVWVSGLVETSDAGEEGRLAEAYADHWAEGCVHVASCGSASAEGGGGHPSPRQRFRGRSGLFGSRTSSMESAVREPSRRMRGRSGLFGRRTLSLGSAVTAVPSCLSGVDALLPMTFGRPDFTAEIQAIGKARREHDIHVYACGNGTLVESLHDICKVCNEHARAKDPSRPQRYIFRREHFGGD